MNGSGINLALMPDWPGRTDPGLSHTAIAKIANHRKGNDDGY
jgi:hypothetical protein